MRTLKLVVIAVLCLSLTGVASDAYLEVETSWTTQYATAGAVAPYGYFDPHQPNYDFYQSNPFNHAGHQDASYDVTQSWEGPGKVNSTKTFSGLPASFSLEDGHSYAMATGYADANNLKLGVYGSTASAGSAGPNADSYVTATFENKFTLLPSDNSSLQIGDKVLLSWNFDFVGHMDLGGKTFPTNTDASVEFDASSAIRGTTLTCGGQGEAYHCGYPTLAEWWTTADAQLYDVNGNYWDHIGDSYVDRSWGASSNHGVDYRDDESLENLYKPPSATANMDISAVWSANFGHDDVPGGLIFEATMGDTLTISSELWMHAWSHGEANARGDFFDTLSNQLVPLNSGVTLNWQHVPDAPSSVPEPATLVMLGSGILSLGLLRKR